MKKPLTWPLIPALALFLAAVCVSCKTKKLEGGLRVESLPRTSITVNASIFDDWFRVRKVDIGKREKVLTAQVTLDNRKGDCRLEYRYQWLDRNGIALIYHKPPWVAVNASRRELVMLTGIAPSEEVKDFVLEVRMRQPSTRW